MKTLYDQIKEMSATELAEFLEQNNATWLQSSLPIKKQIKAWNTPTPNERGGEK